MSVDAVCRRVGELEAPLVTVTGGEPLAQKGALELISALCDQGYAVSVETSGAVDVAGVDSRATLVMDLKTPGSGEMERNLWENLERLRPEDQLKFVIRHRDDYEWSRRQVLERGLADRCQVLFSPVWGELDPARLADWILADGLPVRLQIQLHKILWGEEPGR